MKNTQKGFVIPLLIAIIALIAVGGGVYYHNKKKAETPSTTQPVVQENTQVEQSQSTKNPTTPASEKNTTPSSISATITLDAKTKIAVATAMMNGYNIMISKNPTKIREYLLISTDGPDKAKVSALSDENILAMWGDTSKASDVKPLEDLATNSAVSWKVNGNTVTATFQSKTISAMTISFSARYIDGKWY